MLPECVNTTARGESWDRHGLFSIRWERGNKAFTTGGKTPLGLREEEQ